MNTAKLIQKKRDGEALTGPEIRFLIEGFTTGAIPDYQMAALTMAICLQGMSFEETTELTRAMMESGRVLEWPRQSDAPGERVHPFYCDKHSTGGVGDKVSLVLVPLVACCGVKVPMISGRGLGHTGGTLDKLASIPGFRADLPLKEFQRVVTEIGCAIIGQTAEICPADRRLYALRDVTGTVASLPLIASSIMSKKLAEGLDGLVLDVKWGSGAFMKEMRDAKALAEAMVAVAKLMGKKTVAFVTDMNQPLGSAAGNALEVEEAVAILRGKRVEDVLEITLTLGSEILTLAGVTGDTESARQTLEQKLSGGEAAQKFADMIEAQHGNPRVVDDVSLLPHAKFAVDVAAPRSGFLCAIDTEQLGWAAIALGAGRKVATDEVDHAVGLSGIRKIGERIERGELLLTLHYNDDRGLGEALELLEDAFQFSEEPPLPLPLVVERIG